MSKHWDSLRKDLDCIDAAKLQPDPETEGRPDKWLILACQTLRMMNRGDVADGLEEENAKLRDAIQFLDRFVDGPLIAYEVPCVTPDGRHAFVESFSSTPVAVIKSEIVELQDEFFEAATCYSTMEAWEKSKGKQDG